jgi:dolichol kinase
LSYFALLFGVDFNLFSHFVHPAYVMPLTIIALVSMMVESLPLKDIDNITVTMAAAALGYFLF